MDQELEVIAKELEASGLYRVLRKVKPRSPTKNAAPEGKIAVIIDLETTGLDHTKHEIIEVGMVKFAYSTGYQITEVIDVFQAFHQPAGSIPAEVVKLTGITDQMVAGHKIAASTVEEFVKGADIVIAHNANFDRKFAEKAFTCFEKKAWACSVEEVDWKGHGFDGSRLGYLLAGCGFFHEAHRAADDCHALVEILGKPLGASGETALAHLIRSAGAASYRIWAEGSPFELKDVLKQRGYRWNDGSNGEPRSWHVEVAESEVDAEIAFLKAEVYGRDVGLRPKKFTAVERYSTRR